MIPHITPNEVIYIKMLKKPISLGTATTVTLALAALASLLRSLAFATAFDHSVGYFNTGAFTTLLYITVALALLGIAVFGLSARRRGAHALACPTRSERSLALRLCAAAVGALLAFSAIWDVRAFTDGSSVLVLVRAIGAVLAIPYFLFPSGKRVLALGLGAHLYGLLLLTEQYFDRYVAMNSPLKLMQQFAIIAFMLYLTFEMYGALGTERPVPTAVFGLLTVFLCTVNGVSCITAGIVGNIVPRNYLIAAIATLAFGLYTAARLYVAAQSPNTNETEAV